MIFTVIYSFNVLPEKCDIFEESWSQFTKLIYEYEGSLGSRLHRIAHQINSDSIYYIAYAQWPSKELWENSGNKLPKEAEAIRDTMKSACLHIETLYELDVINDLLSPTTKK